MKTQQLNPQSKRILDALRAATEPLPSPSLSRTGSGKPDGWCGSFSRRISDIRECVSKENLTVVKTEQTVQGVRHTFYQLKAIQP